MAPGVQCRSGSRPLSRVRQGPAREPVTCPGSCTMVSEAADGGRGDGVVRGAGDAGDEQEGCKRARPTLDYRAGPVDSVGQPQVHPERSNTVAEDRFPAKL